MNATLIATFFSIILILLFAGLARRFDWIKTVYFMGVALWSEWLPVISTSAYMAILASNLSSHAGYSQQNLDLSHYFTNIEMIILFCAGPLFFLRFGNMVASGIIVFSSIRIVASGTYADPSFSLYALAGSVTLVAILGDKMPWHAYKSSPIAHKARELMLVVFTLAALCITVFTITKAPLFSRWLHLYFGTTLNSFGVLCILTVMAVGWISVALGITRHFMLPILSLPTVFVLAFMTSWPAHLLAIPFAICLALSLSVGERRLGLRRGGRSFTASYLRR